MRIFTSLLALLFIKLTVAQNAAEQAITDAWKEKTEWRQLAQQQAHPASTQGTDRSLNNVLVDHSATEIQSEVHAAINPTDSTNIVAGCNFVSTSTTSLPSETNNLYYTKDFGNTWNASSFSTSPLSSSATILGGGDPNFAFDHSGKLYFSWINLWLNTTNFSTLWDLYWAYSLDGGDTWKRDSISDYIGTAPSSILGSGGAFDKEWLASDNNPSSPYYGNLYCSFFQADANTGNTWMGLRSKTPATGIFDTVSAIVNSGSYKLEQFASDVVDNNGNVHVTFFATVDSLTYSLYHAVSTDGGQTFQPENKISDVAIGRWTASEVNDSIEGVSPTRLYPCSYITCDHSSASSANNLYMVWSGNGIDSEGTTGYDIYFSRSTDGGTTWSTARILNDNTTNLTSDQYYPALTVSSTGRLVISWWDRRNDTMNNNSDIYLTYSDDGGQTFAPDMKVTTAATQFSEVGTQNGGFGIGEYNSILANGSYAIPIWADGRTDDGMLNIYAAFIQLGNDTISGLQNLSTINGALKIFNVFPDPVKDQLNLSYEATQGGEMQISAYDVQGKLVKQFSASQVTAGKGTLSFNTKELASGTYLLKVIFNGSLNVRRFVKAE